MESVIDTDMCITECINVLYLLFIFESYAGLILGARSSTRLPLPLSRLGGKLNCDGWSCIKKQQGVEGDNEGLF